jgi:hypothetical protein
MATIVTKSPAVSTRTLSAIKCFDNTLSESTFSNAFTSTMISASTSTTYPYTSNTPTTGQSGPVNTTYWITG